MPISSELHEQIGQRLRQSREDMLAAVHARTDGNTDDRPAIPTATPTTARRSRRWPTWVRTTTPRPAKC
jgi:hypothetical protein